MLRLTIDHLTRYEFGTTVVLGTHRVMVRPREDHAVRIVSSELDIAPGPTLRWQRDALDNSVAIADFGDASDVLSIRSRVVIEHYEEAPLDFVVDASAVHHPFAYSSTEALLLSPFRTQSWVDDAPMVDAWVESLGLRGSRTETFVLLDRMNRQIFEGFSYRAREEQGVRRPAETLGRREGSCRDFAALFIDACRGLGLAARFVSGYLHSPASEAGHGSTHAWAEVYLPGPGWKGFDPTSGEVVGNAHIPVAVAQHAEKVPPVAGTFIGPAEVTPRLQVTVSVRSETG